MSVRKRMAIERNTRWVEFTDRKKTGLRVSADKNIFGVSAWPYSELDLETAMHNEQLPARDFIYGEYRWLANGCRGRYQLGVAVCTTNTVTGKGQI